MFFKTELKSMDEVFKSFDKYDATEKELIMDDKFVHEVKQLVRQTEILLNHEMISNRLQTIVNRCQSLLLLGEYSNPVRVLTEVNENIDIIDDYIADLKQLIVGLGRRKEKKSL